MLEWIFLVLAGCLEIGGAVNLKYSQGLTRLMPTIFLFIFMGSSLYLLSLAIVTIPLGTAYAVWTGIGASGTAIYGMLFFNESKEFGRFISISMIIIGVIGLKFVTA